MLEQFSDEEDDWTPTVTDAVTGADTAGATDTVGAAATK